MYKQDVVSLVPRKMFLLIDAKANHQAKIVPDTEGLVFFKFHVNRQILPWYNPVWEFIIVDVLIGVNQVRARELAALNGLRTGVPAGYLPAAARERRNGGQKENQNEYFFWGFLPLRLRLSFFLRD